MMPRLPPPPALRLDFDLGVVDPHQPPNLDLIRRSLAAAALQAAQYVQQLWHRVAVAEGLSSSGSYVQGIHSEASVRLVGERMEPGKLVVDYEVVNTSRHAQLVEDGHMAFSLPQRIDWSRTTGSIKMSQAGRPYLHIPFRHYTFKDMESAEDGGMTSLARRNVMPQSIYQQAKELGRTIRRNEGPFRTKAGRFIKADNYDRPRPPAKTRLHRPDVPAGIVSGPDGNYVERRSERFVGRARGGRKLTNPAWKHSKYHGLFKTGPRRHSRYMTIRTITPDSQGWNIPARPGKGIARRVAADIANNNDLSDLIGYAVKATLGDGDE